MWWLILVGGVILLGGFVWVWYTMREEHVSQTIPPDAEIGGYGHARWERERSIWQATLRRLERQATRYEVPPPYLEREIERARGRLAHAEAMLTIQEEQQDASH